jgi:hypothetical protein
MRKGKCRDVVVPPAIVKNDLVEVEKEADKEEEKEEEEEKLRSRFIISY